MSMRMILDWLGGQQSTTGRRGCCPSWFCTPHEILRIINVAVRGSQVSASTIRFCFRIEGIVLCSNLVEHMVDLYSKLLHAVLSTDVGRAQAKVKKRELNLGASEGILDLKA